MTDSIPALGIESISVFAMPPVEYVELVAALGLEYIGFCPRPMTPNPHDYPAWSLGDDAALRRATVAALAANGVKVAAADGLFLLPGKDVSAIAGDLDALAEIGAPLVNAVSFDRDMARNTDQFGQLAEMAAARGMRAAVEFVPSLGVGDLATALTLVRAVGRADFGVTIDPMHLFRSGGTVADAAAVPANEIAHIQVCDVPLVPIIENYGRESLDARFAPGEGELPLDALFAVLPRMPVIGIEIPQLALAEAGMGPCARLAPVVAASRALLERVARQAGA